MTRFRNRNFWRLAICLLGAIAALFGLAFLVRAAIAPPPLGAWSAGSNLSEPRAGASAALLPTGQILVTGGDSGSGPASAADLVSPTDGTISAASPMLIAREHHISVALQNGQVLVAGGVTTGGGVTNEAEIYDPALNNWSSVPGGMAEARAGATATLLPSGEVLIAGGVGQSGVVSSTAEIFDPNFANDNHTPFSMVGGNLSSPREGHAAALLQDGRVLIVGGSDGTAALASSDIYDPAAGTITAGPAMSTTRQNLTATTLLNGLVLIAGGTHGNKDLATLELFDPSANSGAGAFSAPLDATGKAVTLVTARQGQQAVLLPHNGAVLIFGGTSSGVALSSAELFTASVSTSGAWTYADAATGSMTTARSDFTSSPFSNGAGTSVDDGLLLAMGGKDASGNTLSSTELYGFSWVKTNQYEYSPGSTATITGGGFEPGETVQMTLVESPYVDNDGPVTATADSNGNLSATLAIDSQDAGVTFYMSAVGQTSGRVAQTTFADFVVCCGGDGGGGGGGGTNPALTAYKTDNVSGATSLSGGSASWSWTITVQNGGSGTSGTATWSATQVVLEDYLPTGLTYGTTISEPADLDCQITSDVLSCVPLTPTISNSFTLGAGSNFQVGFTAKATSNGTYVNPTGGVCEVDPKGAISTDTSTNKTCGDTVTVGATAPVATGLSLSINPTSVPLGSSGPVSLQATLTAGASDVSGATVTFDLNGSSVGTATTNTSGVATLSLDTSSYTAGSGTAQASFAATTLAGTTYSASTSNTETLAIVAPPTITKSFSPTTIAENGTSTLTLTIANPSANTVAESGVAVSDTFPAGLQVAGTPSLVNSCGGTATGTAGSGSLSLTGGSVAVKSSCSVSVNVTAANPGTYTNTTGDVSSTNGGTGTTSDSAALTVLSPPSITKAFGASTIPLNGTTTLTFTLSNPNAATSLTGVGFTDDLPSGLVFSIPFGESGTCIGSVSATAGGNSVSVSGVTLAGGGSCSVVLQYVTGASAGTFINTTGAVSSANGGTGSTASATLTVLSPPSITKTFGASSIVVGGSTSLSFNISNPNPGTALTGVAFTDTLPSGLAVSSPSNGLTGSCGGGTITATPGSGSVSLSGATLATSGSCSFSVNVTGTAAGTENNQVQVTSTNGGTGNTSTASLTVIALPTITILKNVVPATLPSSRAGDTFGLALDGVVKATGGNGATTGAITTTVGQHTVSEAEPAGDTTLNNYVTSINCGAGNTAGTSLTLTLAAGTNTTCTITNVLATVTVAATNTTTSKSQPQYSDPVTFTATLYTSPDSGLADGVTTASFFVGSATNTPGSGATNMGHCTLADNGSGQMTCNITEPLVDATTTASGNFAPGSHIAYGQFTDDSNNLWAQPATDQITNTSSSLVPFVINPEDAAITYTGQEYFSSTSSMMSVPVSYTLQDATATGSGTIYDAYPGDITKATATLTLTGISTSFSESCTPSVVAVSGAVGSNGLPSTATIACTFTNVPVGDTFNLSVQPDTGSYYTFTIGDTGAESITTATGGSGFVTGGGYQTAIYLDTNGNGAGGKYSTTGFLQPAPGTKMNFGFEAHFLKNGKLQGGVNLIIRSKCLTNIPGYTPAPNGAGLCVYQVKAPQGLLSSLTDKIKSNPPYAELDGQAMINDVTWATAVQVGTKVTLQIQMYDVGDPGPGANVDPLSIQLIDSTNGLWFSNNWSGANTVLTTTAPVIQGGDLQVR